MKFQAILATIFAAMLTVPSAPAAETDMDKALRTAFERGELRGLHAVVAIYKGNTIAESYFEGADQNWGAPLGVRTHGPDTLHDLRSVTKSMTSLLYGIALDKGMVAPPTANLLAQFPEYTDLPDDAQRRTITIGDTLSMQMGIAWNEDLPYTDPRNSEIAMELSKDRYRYVLSRPMIGAPGDRWVYNGGATALIGRLVEKGTGMPLDQFAEDVLFTPLGITKYEWARGTDGVPSPASGLRLSAHSMVKIAEMIKAGGVYAGKRIVSEDWLAQSKIPRATNVFGLRYGYFWWLPAGTGQPRWMAGFGNGGQRLTVNSTDDLILLIFGGRYNEPDNWRLPVKVIQDFLVPAITAKN